MSVKVMGWVWDQDIKRNLKFVLLAYADHANHDGFNVFPAYDTVAKKTGYSRRQVITITKKLEKEGFMIPDGVGPKGTNKWRIPITHIQGGEETAPPDMGGVKFTTSGGEISARGGEVATSPEPSINHQLTVNSDDGIPNYRLLSSTFVNETGIPELTGGVQSWNEAIKEMDDAGVIPDDIAKAVDILREKNYSIVRPRSVVNTAISVMSERKTKKKVEEYSEVY